MTKLPPIIYILFAVLLWSTGGLFIKWTTLDAFSVNAGRSLFAALTVAAFTYRKGLKLDWMTLLTAFFYAVYCRKIALAAVVVLFA